MGAILATPIRVVDQSAWWAFCRHTAKQRLADQVFGHALAHGVAHQVATEQIFVACQIESTLIRRDVGNVGHPDLIGGGRLEFLLQQVWRNRHDVIRVRRRLELAFLFAAYPQFPTNAFDAVNAGIDAIFSQIFLESLWTIGLAGALVGSSDFHFQSPLILCPF